MIHPPTPPDNPGRRETLRELLRGLLQARSWSLAELLRGGFSPAEVGQSISDLRAAGIAVESIHEPNQPLLASRLQVVAINPPAATSDLDSPGSEGRWLC